MVLHCRNRVEHCRLLGLRLQRQLGIRDFLLGDDVRQSCDVFESNGGLEYV